MSSDISEEEQYLIQSEDAIQSEHTSSAPVASTAVTASEVSRQVPSSSSKTGNSGRAVCTFKRSNSKVELT
jgi:hypothetical protein